jgi:RimJ/RimL family protein N-acetyltransferase
MIALKTARLTINPCRPSDRDDFIALEKDPEVMRFLNGGNPVHLEDGDPNSTYLMPRGTEPHVWTARRIDDSAFVGWFCLWPNSETVGELGYRLRREAWGDGLASEGAAALVNWGFQSCNYEKIFACTMTANHASRRVLEKVGMRLVRTTLVDWAGDIPGSELGEVVYEVMGPIGCI